MFSVELNRLPIDYYYLTLILLMSQSQRIDQPKRSFEVDKRLQEERLLKIQKKLISRKDEHSDSDRERQGYKNQILIEEYQQYQSPSKTSKGHEAFYESPTDKPQRLRNQTILDQQLFSQNRQFRPKSIRDNHWDDSFNSLLKSNEGYRRELLSAYEQKVKMQVEKSNIQKEYINLQYQNQDLIARNKELHVKIHGIGKQLTQVKEISRKNIQSLQGDNNRLRHELNLCNIDKEQTQKAYKEISKSFKQLQNKFKEGQTEIQVNHVRIEQLRSEISFLMGKINESQEEYFILQQKLSSAQRNSDNLSIKLKMSMQQVSKLAASIDLKQQEISLLKVQYTEEINAKQTQMDEKMRHINKNQMKIKDLSKKVAYLQQQNINLRDINHSLNLLQSQNDELRKFPSILEELSCKYDRMIVQNAKLRSQKEHFHELFEKQNILLEEVSKQYEDLIKINQAKEVQDRKLFDQQIRVYALKLKDLQAQLQSSKEDYRQLQGQLMQKENEANYNAELIRKLQQLTEEKIQIIEKHSSQEQKLKRIAQNKTQETKQNKRVINNLAETLKNEKQKWENIANTNKSLLQQKQTHIETLNRQFLEYKTQKQQKQIDYQKSIKRMQEKLKLNLKQTQLLKQKISQLEQSEEELSKKCYNLQQNITKLQLESRQLNITIESRQKQHNIQQQQIKKLELDKKLIKQRETQLIKALTMKQVQIERKSANIQDLELQMQRMKKARQNDYVMQQAQTKRKSLEKYRQIQQKSNKYQQCMRLIFNQLSAYRNNISEIKNFSTSGLQKLALSLNSPQKYSLLRQIQKISQLNTKIVTANINIDRAIDFIKTSVEINGPSQNDIIVKQRNMYKVNKFYRN